MTRTALHLAGPAAALLWLLVIDGIHPAPDLHLAVVAATLAITLLAFWCTRIATGPAIALLLVTADVCLTRDVADDLVRSDPATTALALTSLVGLVVGALVGLGPLPHLFAHSKKRQRARSDLYGRARLLGGRDLAPLLKARGLVLGETDRGRLISWPLEGSAITFAPPRTGKGATIALNLLSPDGRSHGGATLTIDPRGETYCIAAGRWGGASSSSIPSPWSQVMPATRRKPSYRTRQACGTIPWISSATTNPWRYATSRSSSTA